jgi:hypothetical protein
MGIVRDANQGWDESDAESSNASPAKLVPTNIAQFGRSPSPAKPQSEPAEGSSGDPPQDRVQVDLDTLNVSRPSQVASANNTSILEVTAFDPPTPSPVKPNVNPSAAPKTSQYTSGDWDDSEASSDEEVVQQAPSLSGTADSAVAAFLPPSPAKQPSDKPSQKGEWDSDGADSEEEHQQPQQQPQTSATLAATSGVGAFAKEAAHKATERGALGLAATEGSVPQPKQNVHERLAQFLGAGQDSKCSNGDSSVGASVPATVPSPAVAAPPEEPKAAFSGSAKGEWDDSFESEESDTEAPSLPSGGKGRVTASSAFLASSTREDESSAPLGAQKPASAAPGMAVPAASAKPSTTGWFDDDDDDVSSEDGF